MRLNPHSIILFVFVGLLVIGLLSEVVVSHRNGHHHGHHEHHGDHHQMRNRVENNNTEGPKRPCHGHKHHQMRDYNKQNRKDKKQIELSFTNESPLKSGSCHYSTSNNKEVDQLVCNLAVDQTVLGIHVNFTASVSLTVDFKYENATIIIIADNTTILQKQVTLQDLTIPICAPIPILDKIISICLDISKIKFNANKECFSAMLSIDLKVLFKTIPLLPPFEIGFNESLCDEMKEINRMNNERKKFDVKIL
ncbi:hypothetical protein ABK040_005282 [Willaertia magna]